MLSATHPLVLPSTFNKITFRGATAVHNSPDVLFSPGSSSFLVILFFTIAALSCICRYVITCECPATAAIEALPCQRPDVVQHPTASLEKRVYPLDWCKSKERSRSSGLGELRVYPATDPVLQKEAGFVASPGSSLLHIDTSAKGRVAELPMNWWFVVEYQSAN